MQLTTLVITALGIQVTEECFEVGEGVCMAGRLHRPRPPGTAGMEGEPTRIGDGLVCVRTHLLLDLGQPTQGEGANQRRLRIRDSYIKAAAEDSRRQLLEGLGEVQNTVGMVVTISVEVLVRGSSISVTQGTCSEQQVSVARGHS